MSRPSWSHRPPSDTTLLACLVAGMAVNFLPWWVRRETLTPQKSTFFFFFSGTSFPVIFCSLLLRLPSSGPTYLKLIELHHLTSMHFEIDSNPHLVAPFLTCYFLNVLLRKALFSHNTTFFKKTKIIRAMQVGLIFNLKLLITFNKC